MPDFVSLPTVSLNIIPSRKLQENTEHKVLFIGQKTAAGTATAGALQELVLERADIDTRFGRRSHLAQMMRAARKLNGETQFDAIALDDNGAGVAATATIALTGTATAAGTLTFEVCSGKNNVYTVDVSSGDTAAAVATALYNQMNADADAPFTVVNAPAGSVVATAANDGNVGNSYLLRTTGSVAGLTVTLTPWAGGATDPSLTGLFDVIEGMRYQTIVWPGHYSLTAVTDLLDDRFNVTNDVQDGVAITCKTDTLANLKAAALAQNSQSLTLIGNKAVSTSSYAGSHLREMNDVVASYLAAARSLRLTDDANLADVVVTTAGPLDQFGGISLATLPYFNTPYPELPVPVAGTFWTDLEQGELSESGVTVIGSNRAKNGVIQGETYTTYVNDPAGNPDETYHYLNTVDASSAGREFTFLNLKRRYVQSRLTKGDVLPGFSMENEATIRGFMQTLYSALAELGIYQKGREAERAYNQSLRVTITLTPGRGLVTINHAPWLVGQLRAIQGTVQVAFGTEG